MPNHRRWRVVSRERPRLLSVQRFWTREEAEVILGFARSRVGPSRVVIVVTVARLPSNERIRPAAVVVCPGPIL